MSKEVMGLDKDDNGMKKKYVHACESDWLGRWTRMSSSEAMPMSRSRLSLKEDAKCPNESSVGGPEAAVGAAEFGENCRDTWDCERVDANENLRGRRHGKEVFNASPFPMLNAAEQSEGITATRTVHNTLCDGFQAYPKMEVTSSFHEDEGSSSQAMAIRRPLMPSWMHSRHENALQAPHLDHKETFGSNHDPGMPVQVKSARNTLDLIRPMRIYATVDSAEGASEEPYGISQTTGHFLLSKKTDLNMSKDGQVFRESTVSMKLKGTMFRGFLDLFPTPDLRHPEGVRLQSLGSSKDGEEGPRKDHELKSSAACEWNESSAETDTFNMDNFQRIRLSGSTSTLSPKGQGRKNQSAVPRVEIPDMNQEPPVVPDGENSVDGHGGEEASTSATRSMNTEHLLSNTEFPRECKRERSDPEPCSSWFKRLKTGASDSYSELGTKSMKIEEVSPSEKVSHIFHGTIKCGATNPEPFNEEPSAYQIKNKKPGGGEDITLLHPWIQRWCKSKAVMSHQLTGQEPDCEAQTSKEAAVEEVQKKQFPSIAAMALMGKALSGLSPTCLRKNGSLLIWNTPDLR